MAAYAEIVSSIAIVLTLIYLAVQTQQMRNQTAQMAVQTEQTNNILLSSSRQATLEGDLAILELIADHPEYGLLSRISDRELTEIEGSYLDFSKRTLHVLEKNGVKRTVGIYLYKKNLSQFDSETQNTIRQNIKKMYGS